MTRTTRIRSLLLVGVAATLAIGSASYAAQQPRTFIAEDWLDIVTFSGGSSPFSGSGGRPTLSPNGEWVAYVLPDMEDEWNVLERRKVGWVYVQPANGGAPKPLSQGKNRSSFPTWSPDGKRLAFFLEGPDGGRLAIWNSDSDETGTLGEAFHGRAYLAPQWDSTGNYIVAAAAAKIPETDPLPRVRVVKSTDKRIPGDAFFINKRQAMLRLFNTQGGTERGLTSEAKRVRSFALSPRGTHVIYQAPSPETFGVIGEEKNETFLLTTDGSSEPRRVAEDGERLTWSPDGQSLLVVRKGKLQAIPVSGGDPRPFLEGLELSLRNLHWSPNGKQFVTLIADKSIQDPETEPPQPKMYSIARPFMDLYLVSASSGEAKNLTSSFEDQVSNPTWSPDGKTVFFRTTDNQTYDETIYKYEVSNGKLTALTQGKESYRGLSTAPGKLALTVQSATHPPDLFLLDTDQGTRSQITELNPQLSQFRFSTPELFYYHNADGQRMGALLYKPVDFSAGQKVPVITNVYEKLTPRIHQFQGRRQIFLNHGYAVLMPNMKIKVGEAATSFVEGVVPAVNTVRAMGFTNGKFAMWGGSFGGFATSYVITQTDIFACAVSRATPPEIFRNWASGRDRDSNNIERGQARMGATPFEAPHRYLSQSAFFQLDKVNTPVLIMHGVEDYTILFAEGEMMFYALRRLGKEAELVIYTHGDHSLSRHSRSDTLDVNRRMLDWFEKYLKPPEALPTDALP